jgi:hypothetical protein
VVVTEGEGVAAGLRKLEEEAASSNYAKVAQAGMGRARVRGLWEEGRADWPLGRFGLKVKKNLFSE